MLIGELSSHSGVSPRSLRHYEQLGLITSSRSSNGYRHYDDSAVAVASTIKTMFDLGFPRETVRTVLPCATGQHVGVDRQLISRNVEQMKDDIAERIAQLTQTHDTLAAFLAQD